MSEHIDFLPAVLTSDHAYLRFMGDFKQLTKFNRIQLDKSSEIADWWGKLSKNLNELKFAYVLCSNHYAGFAPATVNRFRELAGMDQKDWTKLMSERLSNADGVLQAQ